MGQETSDKMLGVAAVVMCQAPLPGRSKTRLSPPLSNEEAAALSACFIADVAETIGSLDPELDVQGVAAFPPSHREEAIRTLLPSDFILLSQRGDDLSARSAGVVEDLLTAGYRAVCLLSADSPTLPPSLLSDAVEALGRPGERVVLGPAVDGGYTLIGVQRPLPELFDINSWSTTRALRQKITGAAPLSVPVETLKPWYDVHDGLALAWLLRELLGDGVSPLGNGVSGALAPRTRAYLSSLGGRGDGPPPDPGPNAKDPRGRT